ncbi:hypothetical protein [Ralstonia solanacearum]|uniref:Uncharacterized protein n=1 Tax=Ralstonia solanacearum TaxID=305 RepID=A0AAD0WGS2_RALSL|nr:hypothetical protein [Ralstonia solanacearum]AXV81287.1 hypothetical protein CJO77_06785 [Ralstonia solanacearum]
MELKIKGKAHLDELSSVENIFLLTVIGDDGEFGFQQNEISKEFLSKMTMGACYLTISEAAVVDADNMSALMNRLTLGKRYGILMHGGTAVHRVEREIATYLSKKKLDDLKRSKGMDVTSLPVPDIFSFFFDGTSFQQMAERMLGVCDYLSIWPRYWGNLGEHCYVWANNAEVTASMIEREWSTLLHGK